MSDEIVIVGGGQAAASAAAKLRELDSEVKITMLCGVPVLPYQRPPLSKKYLSGEMPLERLILRPQSWYDDHNVDVRCGRFVNLLNREKKQLTLADDSQVTFDKLLLVTGASPRKLPAGQGDDTRGVHYLRAAGHADKMRPVLGVGNRLVVIGGGYIGLEVAAVAAQIGMKVTLVELADRILQRVAAPQTSDYFRHLHADNGVTILEETGLTRILSTDGRVCGVELSDGSFVDADCVLIGIGVEPATGLAQRGGLSVDNGVVVDHYCRTSDPDIYAAGDCTSFSFKGMQTRLESVPHAIHQAETAAKNMLGGEQIYKATPWFWSDQFDVKLQIAGLGIGYDDTIVRPGKRPGSQSIWYYCGQQLLAVDAMNDAPSFMMARRILEAGKNLPKNIAADATANLKDWK
jgi:3-phenylpropionate/trans-cinnamate dioxygenase ferredoxin reductase subunit